jgi:hypothetical protein
MIIKFSGSSDPKINDIDIKYDGPCSNIRDIFIHLHRNITDEFFNSDGYIKDGVLCLVDDSDWELYNCYDVDITDVKVITLINTIHGG